MLVPEHLFFITRFHQLSLVAALPMTRTEHRVSTFCGASTKRNADIRPDVPGGRCARWGGRHLANTPREGGIQMAKKTKRGREER